MAMHFKDLSLAHTTKKKTKKRKISHRKCLPNFLVILCWPIDLVIAHPIADEFAFLRNAHALVA